VLPLEATSGENYLQWEQELSLPFARGRQPCDANCISVLRHRVTIRLRTKWRPLAQSVNKGKPSMMQKVIIASHVKANLLQVGPNYSGITVSYIYFG
jgi:hypothetical protein